ncbi:acyl-CoA synthetase [Comamonas serinivorans]|uniref:Acyl-CoA synthetase n=1 Tax=Comamonas serinivorans TaxID=1082851 RepID=A0A1Y0ESP6_9BURK|nr:AMP-binding protein [Comamonas serinivorans]ARU06694.1 acyl-CoA synthetase [Comamonas serinivorans]
MTGASATQPWLQQYAPGQPARITPQFSHMIDLLAAALAAAPDRPFIRYFDGQLTLREVDAAADALAAQLQARGFAPGDRLAVYTQNNPAFVIGLLAAWKAGGVAVPVNPMNKQRELRYILGNSGAQALLCLDELWHEVVAPMLAQGDGSQGDGAQNDDGPLALKTVVTTSALDWQSRTDRRVLSHSERLPVPHGVVDLLAIARSGDRPRPLASVPSANDLALLTYTSGTTGKPKGAMNTHGNLAFNAQVYRDWVGVQADDVVLGLAPLFHITGLVGHMALALRVPCTLVLCHRFTPEVMLDAIRETRPTFTIGAITAFLALMNHPGVTRADFASFRAIYSGGAPIAPATADAFERLTGHVIHNAFGMTETCSPSHMVPLGVKPPVDPVSGAMSIGVPVYNTTVRIVNDAGQEAAVGEIGEIVSAGPQIMRGYWHMPEATEAALLHGGMRTGDVGFMDERGWFYLVDRKKDMINAGGYKVWPREVEDVLYQHPAVREVAVVGVPDAYRGETVKAVVSLKAGHQATADELIAHCKANMAAYKYPRLIEFRDELPKTVTGKILRREVR